MTKKIESLLKLYDSKKNEIKGRIQDFRKILEKPEEKIFSELCFCICTPQSKAEVCERAISKLEENKRLFSGDEEQIRPFLNLVRFPENKTKNIIKARKFFTKDGKLKIKETVRSFKDLQELRDWLAYNIRGFGYKESSHFLRNIGLGEDLAILDRHILKNLMEYEVIDKIPKSLTRKKYLEIEQRMKKFSKKIGIPLAELDLLLWFKETGKIVK